MIGDGTEKNLTWSTMMVIPEISSIGMKKADPHGAKPNRTIGSCTLFR